MKRCTAKAKEPARKKQTRYGEEGIETTEKPESRPRKRSTKRRDPKTGVSIKKTEDQAQRNPTEEEKAGGESRASRGSKHLNNVPRRLYPAKKQRQGTTKGTGPQ